MGHSQVCLPSLLSFTLISTACLTATGFIDSEAILASAARPSVAVVRAAVANSEVRIVASSRAAESIRGMAAIRDGLYYRMRTCWEEKENKKLRRARR